ncbi:hypothetical protein GCM10011360_02650 [Primorskyibacter flagellatus]|uniref:Uncharacterized protein n=1 Tax=Primorskyibacter flagellatus TaxID=1387277 RepID=A0A917E9P3_9RHOB|nr:hypothetical protein [Primorskyibacter flagellatus]GGE17304.1 hypothetical protein GCM10011360_02650 [Primorskyibacter flagellatus]
MLEQLGGGSPDLELKQKPVTGFGFYPMVEVRYHQRPGRLVEVDVNGHLVSDVLIFDNAAALEALRSKTVVLPPGFPSIHARLEAVGATIKVHNRSVDAYKLAEQAFSDVDWI